MTLANEHADDLRELYRELILDHARNPRHFGAMEAPTHVAEGINPLCGDKLKLYCAIGENQTIDDIQFEGTGCAISIASASLLTESVCGLSTREALELFNAVLNQLSTVDGGAASNTATKTDLGKLAALEGVKEYPARVKCATLAWHALKSAINQSESPASSE